MEKQYYIASGKDHVGPFTLSQMKNKELAPETLIWYEGLAQWTKVEDLEELKATIPVIVTPPLTPVQIEAKVKKIKTCITQKLLGRSVKYVGVVFLIVFLSYGVVQYIALNKQEFTESSYNMYSGRTQYQTYRMSTEDVLSSAAISAFMMAFIMSLVSLPVFYFIEKQKPYKDLLVCKDKTEEEIFQELVKEQEEKYVYKEKLSSTPFVIGCIILGLNFFFGIFPEYKVFHEEEGIVGFAFVAIGVRIAAFIFLLHQVEIKSRSFLWLILAVILPAIALMIVGSLYPLRKHKVVDKGEGYSCSSDKEEVQDVQENKPE